MDFEQRGKARAEYGQELLKRLAGDLTARHGRGFSVDNLESMRLLYAVCGTKQISETLSRKLALAPPLSSAADISETPSRILPTPSEPVPASPFSLADVARAFPLP